MSRRTPRDGAVAPGTTPATTGGTSLPELPRGRMPAVGVREIVAALHRRRERRRATAAELHNALQTLASSVEVHLARVSDLRAAIEAQGGDLSHLQHYDSMMARLRAELRSAEQSLATVFSTAARA